MQTRESSGSAAAGGFRAVRWKTDGKCRETPADAGNGPYQVIDDHLYYEYLYSLEARGAGDGMIASAARTPLWKEPYR